MIQIKKGKKPPIVRYTSTRHVDFGVEKYVVATRNICNDFKTNPASFLIAGKQFNDDYGSEKFRIKLIKVQGHKCCYCEKPLDNGQVEHYRPKAAYKMRKGAIVERPGYYWLAYQWDNLLVSCGECNHSGRKGICFPIKGAKRAKKPADSLKKEQAIIINPANEDPSKYISFNRAIPFGVDKMGRGKENIELFDLKNRPDLKSAREDILELYITKKEIATLKKATGSFTLAKIKAARTFLKTRLDNKKPFAGMLIENIKNGLI